MASKLGDKENDPVYPPPPPDFDPFDLANRNVRHPTTDCETLVNVLKSCFGTGILSMPAAFMAAGLLVGTISTIIVAIICMHCGHILVVSAHALYYRTGKTSMTYTEVAEVACRSGPKWCRKFAYVLKNTVLYGIFLTYFTTCSCYAVIVASNFEQVLSYYMDSNVNIRVILAIMVVPSILICLVPNLKYLAPFSMVATLFMITGLGITLYYLVIDLPPISDRKLYRGISTYPVYFSITLFALQAIGVILPSANNMKNPRHFSPLFGVLNIGIFSVTILYISIGFMGYYKYGEETLGVITLNLPEHHILAQSVKILIALAVFCTSGLQFYIAMDILWDSIKNKFSRPVCANYVIRFVLSIVAILISIALPQIIPFVGLIGAFFFSILGILVPVFIELIVFWDRGFGCLYWRILKNIIIVMTGLGGLVFGTKAAIEDMIETYY